MEKTTFDEHGREILDPTPLALPVGFKRPETLEAQIQRLIKGRMSQAAAEAGYETFEDAEDFEIDEDDEPSAPYEMNFDPILGREISPEMVKSNPDQFKEEFLSKAVDSPEIEDRIAKKAKAYRRQRQPQEEKARTQGGGPEGVTQGSPSGPAPGAASPEPQKS